MKKRLFTAAVLCLGLALAGAQQAEAEPVFFSGFTAGCFGPGCTPVTGVSTFPAANGIMYTSSTFSGTTTDGVLTIDGANNFGTFQVGNLNPFDYTGTSFSLLITFIDPVANQNLFTALLNGAVVMPLNAANVDILFDPTPQVFGSGNTYSVRVNSIIDLPIEQQVTLGGELAVPAQAVPEPITMVLFGTGLAGLGVARRRRRASPSL